MPAQTTPLRAAVEGVLTVELASVVAGARRRALRDGDRQIDTAHLLHSLMESDPEVRAAVGDASQIARVLGYLVQRSIGYGLRWQSSVEDSGAVPVLREGRSAAGSPARWGADSGSGWSPSAVAAMEGAFARAGLRGDARVRGTDVLACIAVDPRCRAVEVLRRAGVDTNLLAERIPGRSRHVSPG
ncbi:Clp protease N-terminal domain-containing protein [Streptomyces sp. NPDC006208]|uniref:Clp protease N-terminal domain-containing protein n=1 Tax=Streptomyces sp. NPDC006208 TaxID=3156734 RepID=UPI00339F994F